MKRFYFWVCIWCLFWLIVALAFITRAAYAESPSMTVRWEANSEPDLAGYRVHWGYTNQQFGEYTPIDVGNVTTHTIEDLPAGRRIHVVATAYDAYGNESGYSDSVSRVMVIPGDLDGDGDVDGSDLAELSRHYGMVAGE